MKREMRRKLIMHIGTEKTGTTSIQNFLYSNELILASSGIGLLHSAGKPNNSLFYQYAGPRRELNNVIKRQLSEDSSDDWRSYFENLINTEIKALSSHIHTVVISSEHLSSHLISPEKIQKLADLFIDSFDQFLIVAYFRRQDRFVVSRHSTSVKAGSHRKFSFPIAGQSGFLICDYYTQLTMWATVFGVNSIRPRIFDREKFRERDLLADFSSVCGFYPLLQTMFRPVQLNTSLSASALHLMREVNVAFKSVEKHSDPKLRQLRKSVLEQISKNYEGQPSLPMRSEAQGFFNLFSKSNDDLAQQWFSGEQIFNHRFDDYPVEPQPVNIPSDAISKIIEILLHHLDSEQIPSKVHRMLSTLSALDAASHLPMLLRQTAKSINPVYPNLASRLKQVAMDNRRK
jgi:hypothetical protein